MTAKAIEDRPRAAYADRPFPPGKIKIMAALESLLEEKEFGSITTAEIAKTAGVTEGLIYKHFQDKRDLLHQVLAEFLDFFITRAEKNVLGITGTVNRLRQVIRTHISMYAYNRVFAKILILEVRSYPDYFNSDAYAMVKRYTNFLLEVIEEGVSEGSIRSDIPSTAIRQIILGGIEHVCLPGVLFSLPIDPDEVSEQLAEVILGGIATGR